MTTFSNLDAPLGFILTYIYIMADVGNLDRNFKSFLKKI
jgi:uncharacterized membrane protein (DUF485 family)